VVPNERAFRGADAKPDHQPSDRPLRARASPAQPFLGEASEGAVGARTRPSELDLVIFVGLQASGKTTFYRERFAATHVHVSKDELRNVRHREARQRELVHAALTSGRSVVVDNTNATREDRAALIAQGRAFGARVVGYHFASRVPESLARNRGREGRARVPDIAIFATARRFQAPSHTEGFDALWRVGIAGDMRFEVSEIGRDEPPASTTTATAEVS
jgi:predicted kinase